MHVPDHLGFQGQLLGVNSFCRRSFSVQRDGMEFRKPDIVITIELSIETQRNLISEFRGVSIFYRDFNAFSQIDFRKLYPIALHGK